VKNFKFNKNSIIAAGVISFAFGFFIPVATFAATTPSLGTASTFGVLSGTFTPTIASTTITGNLGYTTLATGLYFTVSGSTYIGGGVGDAAYRQAGIDQNNALNNVTDGLNIQPCTDISSLTPASLNGVIIGGGAPGVFPSGCYFSSGALGIDANTAIHLAGAGTYIFKSTGGALTTGAGSQVILNPGASACDVFWVPVGATTLGATSTFEGTVIDAAGISIGDTVNWMGRALAFGGTVGTNHDIITVPACVPPATLHVIKHVIGGTEVAANFTMIVTGTNVSSSSFPGSEASTTITLDSGAYNVNEVPDANYTKTLGLSCSGTVTSGQDITCLITNDYIAPTPIPATLHVIKFVAGGILGPSAFMVHVENASGMDVSNSPLAGAATPGTLYSLPAGNYTVSEDANTSYAETFDGFCPGGNVSLSVGQDLTCTVINTNIPSLTAAVSSATGFGGLGSIAVVPLALPGGAGSTTVATVVVGAPIVPPLINIVKVPSRLTSLPYGGGTVTSTYAVTTPGAVAPGLPNTGLPPEGNSIPWNAMTSILLRTSSQTSQNFEQTSSELPVRLEIPKINIDATIGDVGLTSNGEMGAPVGPTSTVWFDLGSRPGENGSAVIAGHDGWKNGTPAVFDDLYKLQIGDKVYVTDGQGIVTVFVVRRIQTYDQNGDASDVFNSNDGKAHLNLITCAGTWNATQKSYSNRLVVFTDMETK
jgi:LPXTG-site transpeptidase (sortase) family protein